MCNDSKTRFNIIKSWNIQSGDFVNFVGWPENVWSEVKEVVGPYIVIYDCNEKGRTSMVDIANVKKLCRKENIHEIINCKLFTSNGAISEVYSANQMTQNFSGDKNIYIKDGEYDY